VLGSIPVLQAVVAVLFLISRLVRMDNPDHVAGAGPFTPEIIAIAIGGVAAWLGGELVDRLGIGVDGDANPDASSPLGRTPRLSARQIVR
jgi:hypothetical protein